MNAMYPGPEWFRDYSKHDVGLMDSDVEGLGGEYTTPAISSVEADILIDATDAVGDAYDTKGLIAQLSGDTDDSEELRANVQNLIDRNVRNFVFALHRKV